MLPKLTKTLQWIKYCIYSGVGQRGLEVEWISDVWKKKQTRQETMGRQRRRSGGEGRKGSAKLAQLSYIYKVESW